MLITLKRFFFHKLILLSLILAFLLALLINNSGSAIEPDQSEILWDTYGVPHIYSEDENSSFYAFGWAQMHSHGNLLLRLYGQARGRAAEYWGEQYLESDQWVWTMGIPDRARQWYKEQSPAFRKNIDAFAAGINDYAKTHPELLSTEVEAVLPINPIDVLAHLQRVLHFTFVVNQEQVGEIQKDFQTAKPAANSTMGSNAWAIGPSRSASGNAMLLINPHLFWSDRFLWYEAQIQTPDMDAYGASLVGIPVLNVAFNNNLGWAHTINQHDGWDAYELTLAEKGYEFDGQVRAFETEQKTLKIKQEDGTLQEETLTIQHSIHGPVIAKTDESAIALRVVGLDEPGALEQWWEMGRAENLSEFETALKRLQLPTFTVMYADREGHILHLFNGQVPIREQGDFEYWSGLIPGDTSTTLWSNTHSYEELPRVLDPASGWLQNANDAPWTTTFPKALEAADYPLYMAPQGPMQFRAQRSAGMLAEDETISFEELIAYKHSTRMELADRVLDDLIGAARQQGGELVEQAANVLENWDRQANADSQGAVLFTFWNRQVNREQLFATGWSEDFPLTTPDHLADPVQAVDALKTAAAQVKETYGALDVPWGEVFRLQAGELDLPANGAPGRLGSFRTVRFAPMENRDRFQAILGDSYVAAIEFSDPVRARALTSYGNATQPHSSHVGDQLELFAQQELRPVWRSRSEIQAHLTSRQKLAWEK
ncbi:MAG: acylase [Cyanobacteria bacterium]|jgi:acyl-homoserine-lactone acylase|nr:acylase [Cyanobacteria bacterium GSL.Bin1]